MATKYKMQGELDDGTLTSWLSDAPDWSGAFVPGAFAVSDVALDGGGFLTPDVSDPNQVTINGVGVTAGGVPIVISPQLVTISGVQVTISGVPVTA